MNATLPRRSESVSPDAPYDDRTYELIDGIPSELPMPGGNRGYYLSKFSYKLTGYIIRSKRGRVSGADNFVMTKRDPDTVRGADISFYSFENIPADRPLPEYWNSYILPEFICEVNSPSNRESYIDTKTEEYLMAGVQIVVILDGETTSATVHRKGQLPQVFDNRDRLTIPDLFPGFRVAVKWIFE